VTHGIANLPEGGCIRLQAQSHDGRLSILVENTFDSEGTPARRNGLGLDNVRRRLQSRYSTDAAMRVTATDTQFQVNLSLPAETHEVSH
jgi:two-component system sensor histidine kinase AlgZ